LTEFHQLREFSHEVLDYDRRRCDEHLIFIALVEIDPPRRRFVTRALKAHRIFEQLDTPAGSEAPSARAYLHDFRGSSHRT